MAEKFNLKFSDFQTNITTTWSEFRTRTHFQDVTLVSDDQKRISAHRVILSACSGYFNNVLSKNIHLHPLLCLDGINFSELNNVLDFIYTGELQIHQDDLNRFLQIAKRLQLQGLMSLEEQEKKEHNKESFKAGIQTKLSNLAVQNEEKTLILMHPKSNLAVQNEEERLIFMNSKDFQSIEELDSYIDQFIIQKEIGLLCKICTKASSYRSHLREHIESHIKGLSFCCNICGKTLRTRNSLRNHKINNCKS